MSLCFAVQKGEKEVRLNAVSRSGDGSSLLVISTEIEASYFGNYIVRQLYTYGSIVVSTGFVISPAGVKRIAVVLDAPAPLLARGPVHVAHLTNGRLPAQLVSLGLEPRYSLAYSQLGMPLRC